MAADDARGIPEAFKFLAELHELKWIHGDPDDDSFIKEEDRAVRIMLMAYTDWSENGEPEFYARIYEIDYHFRLDKPKEDYIRDPMGDRLTLEKFIEWSKTQCNAEQYLLLLWGHGTGSSMFTLDIENSFEAVRKKVPSFTLYDSDGNRIKSIKELTNENSSYFKDHNKIDITLSFKGKNKSNVFETITLYKRKTKYYKDELKNIVFDLIGRNNSNLSYDSNRLRNYFFYQSNLDALKASEIREAVKEDNQVDIIMIMGCCMQMMEFCFEIKDSCKYLIGSEELIYFNGYNYLDSFTNLNEFPDMTSRQLVKRIIQETPLRDDYSDFERNSLSISCVDLDRTDKMVELIYSLSDKIVKKIDADPYFLNIIRKARIQCRHFGEGSYRYSFIDLIWFLKKLDAVLEDNDKYKGDELIKEIKNVSRELELKFIIENWVGSKRTPRIIDKRSFGGHGLGIYFPESKEAHKENESLGLFFVSDNANTSLFSGDNKWNELITRYMTKFKTGEEYPPEPENINPEERRQKIEIYNENLRFKRIAAKLELKKYYTKQNSHSLQLLESAEINN
ncbi:MAG TPA: clostripain-related cysteine peptidase [Chitinophagaceae bacterium]|nr:clostripain-related cysteine peptidase [Chitinophagaceae bacterium]